MNVRNEIEDLAREHGDELVAKALGYLPRLIALIKAGKARRITSALDEAHAALVDMIADRRRVAVENEARRARADEPTRPIIRDAGEAE